MAKWLPSDGAAEAKLFGKWLVLLKAINPQNRPDLNKLLKDIVSRRTVYFTHKQIFTA